MLPQVMHCFKVEKRGRTKDCPSWICFIFIWKAKAFPRNLAGTSTYISLATTVSHDHRDSIGKKRLYVDLIFTVGTKTCRKI